VRRFSLSLVAVVVLLGLVVAPATSEPGVSRGASPVPYDEIPNLVLDLPDGDKIALGAPDLRRVMLQRYDAATATWSAPELLFRDRDLECGDLDARTSGGAVAVIVECQRHGWSEDQAPTDSVALYSPDAASWSRHRLSGEAYEEPGIGYLLVGGSRGGYLLEVILRNGRWRVGISSY
jgi:hypothetical protein